MHTASAAWGHPEAQRCAGRSPRRGLEIAGIVLGFIFFWPAALAYLAWKLLGYPVPNEWKTYFEKNFSRAFDAPRYARPFYRGTGNLAFEEYRKAELARLEE